MDRAALNYARKLEIRYSGSKPGRADLFVEYVGGRVEVFEVDEFLIERLLEHLEDRERSRGEANRPADHLQPDRG